MIYVKKLIDYLKKQKMNFNVVSEDNNQELKMFRFGKKIKKERLIKTINFFYKAENVSVNFEYNYFHSASCFGWSIINIEPNKINIEKLLKICEDYYKARYERKPGQSYDNAIKEMHLNRKKLEDKT